MKRANAGWEASSVLVGGTLRDDSARFPRTCDDSRGRV